MSEWLKAIEQLGVIEAVRTSFIAYPLINAAHVLAIGALVTCVILMDLRVLGRFPQLPQEAFVRLLRLIALGAFGLAVLTGVVMFAIRATEYAAMPLYWFKLGLILVAALNFAVFSAIDRNRLTDAPPSTAARLSAGLSILLWLSVLVAGRFLGFV